MNQYEFSQPDDHWWITKRRLRFFFPLCDILGSSWRSMRRRPRVDDWLLKLSQLIELAMMYWHLRFYHLSPVASAIYNKTRAHCACNMLRQRLYNCRSLGINWLIDKRLIEYSETSTYTYTHIRISTTRIVIKVSTFCEMKASTQLPVKSY